MSWTEPPIRRSRVAHALVAVLVATFAGIRSAPAHEVRPAFLELTETAEATYDVVWKRPARGDAVIRLTPVFPGDCRELSGHDVLVDGALVRRAVVRCDQPLSGRAVQIAGLGATPIDTVVETSLRSGDARSFLLRGGRDTFTVARPPSPAEVSTAYVRLGVEHILLGPDHLLFVLGLLLIVDGWRRLLGTITAFTVAHSITLGLATLGVVRVPGAPVEAAIALSLLFLAVEVVRRERGEVGWTSNRPWTVAFGVGLLHGLGFAGALSEVGLPASEIPLALFAFNVGVEVGQLAFVAVVTAVLQLARSLQPAVPALRADRLAYPIGILAAFWLIERTASFL